MPFKNPASYSCDSRNRLLDFSYGLFFAFFARIKKKCAVRIRLFSGLCKVRKWTADGGRRMAKKKINKNQEINKNN